MPQPIKRGTAEAQKYHIMKRCERAMNRPGICKAQRVKAIHKYQEYRNVLLARGFCLSTEPA